MKQYLKWINFLSAFPLVLGSATFFYWYYCRVGFSKDVDIELLAFVSLVLFVLTGLIIFILSLAAIFSGSEIKKHAFPFLILLAGIPMIDLYTTAYDELSKKAFIRLEADAEIEIQRIYSDHFELFNSNSLKEFQFSYYPVYNYDWTKRRSIEEYEISPVFIELLIADTLNKTVQIPYFDKGSCAHVKISDILEEQ